MSNKLSKISVVLLIGLSITTFCNGQTSKKLKSKEKFEKLEIKMFPKAEQGFKQVYIQLPILANEADYKVEIFVGQEKEVDCNKHFMSGKIKEENLEGWGYNFFSVESEGQIAGTLMGCPDNKKTKKFITMPSIMTRYNSKLPIVIYTPENLQVRYRIWKAGETLLNTKTTK